MNTHKSAFTTVEVLVVVALVGGIAAVAWPTGPVAKWWQGRASRKAEQATVKVQTAAKMETAATAKVRAHAQESVHKAGAALVLAPPSRPVDVASQYVSEARAALDQTEGPVPAASELAWIALVKDLCSENATIRAKAEAQRQTDTAEIAKLADSLEAARAESRLRQSQLVEAQEARAAADARMVALGQRYQAIKYGLLACAGLAFLLFCGLIYAKAALGGVGKALHLAGAPARVVSELDGQLSKFGQWLIARGRTAAAKIEAAEQIRADRNSKRTINP